MKEYRSKELLDKDMKVIEQQTIKLIEIIMRKDILNSKVIEQTSNVNCYVWTNIDDIGAWM